MAMHAQEFDITEDHLRALQAMVFVWVDLEAGAPGMIGYSPTFHAEEDRLPYDVADRNADLCRILGVEADPANLSAELQGRLDQFHASMGMALEIALELSQILPGDCTYPNYFAEMAYPHLEDLMPYHIEALMPDLFDPSESAFESDHLPVPIGEMITFHLTAEHIKLLRALRVNWDEHHGYTGIETKRPYGDMTYFELDMADVLSIPFSRNEQNEPDFTKEQFLSFNALHNDMLFAVPTLLRHGALRIGHYQIDQDAWAFIG